MGLELPKRARNIALGAFGGSALLFLSGCSAEGKSQLERLAMPVPATEEGQHIYNLWQWSWLAAFIVGIIVWGLILWCVFAYRRRSQSEIPVQTRYHLPIEIFYTVAPIMMVIVLFFFTVETQNNSFHVSDEPDDTVTVIGQQWSWTFNYTDVDSLNGETVHEVGTTEDRPTLYLVKDREVTISLRSPDVIHSFWVPDFIFKLDVIPGKENQFSVTPTRTGTFAGRCAELCGVYHSRMLFDVKVVDQAEFDAKMQELQQAGNTGLITGGADADTHAGFQTQDQENPDMEGAK